MGGVTAIDGLTVIMIASVCIFREDDRITPCCLVRASAGPLTGPGTDP